MSCVAAPRPGLSPGGFGGVCVVAEPSFAGCSKAAGFGARNGVTK